MSVKIRIISIVLLGAAISGCKKPDEPSTPAPIIPSVQSSFQCEVDGHTFRNASASPQHIGSSWQSSGIAALTIRAVNDSEEMQLYIQTPQNTTGTYSIPSQARLTYAKNQATQYPLKDSGEIVITEYHSTLVRGTFRVSHLKQDSTVRNFTNGTFTITIP